MPDQIYAPELRYLNELGPDLQVRARSSSILAQHQLIASGTGVGILPCFIGDMDSSLIRVVPDFGLSRTFWLVTHQDTRRLARISAFVDWLECTARGHRQVLIGRGSDC